MYDVGVGDPVPVIEYDEIVPPGAVHVAVKPDAVAVPSEIVGAPGAFGTVYTVPLVPDPVDAAGPAVPVPPAALHGVTVIGPYPVPALSPEKPALSPETVCGAPRPVPVTTYDKAPDTADQLSVNPDVETPVTLRPVGVVRTVDTAAAWLDAPDVPPELDAVSVNGPYVTAAVRGVPLPNVYDVVAAVPANVTNPPGMLAPVSVYEVTVPPGEPHVNGMVVPVGVPVARLDGALGAVYAVIGPIDPPSDGPPVSATLLRDWSVKVYAVPGLARPDTVYPVD